jgi:hypothetical protein
MRSSAGSGGRRPYRPRRPPRRPRFRRLGRRRQRRGRPSCACCPSFFAYHQHAASRPPRPLGPYPMLSAVLTRLARGMPHATLPRACLPIAFALTVSPRWVSLCMYTGLCSLLSKPPSSSRRRSVALALSILARARTRILRSSNPRFETCAHCPVVNGDYCPSVAKTRSDVP